MRPRLTSLNLCCAARSLHTNDFLQQYFKLCVKLDNTGMKLPAAVKVVPRKHTRQQRAIRRAVRIAQKGPIQLVQGQLVPMIAKLVCWHIDVF